MKSWFLRALVGGLCWLCCGSFSPAARAATPDCSCSREWLQTFRGNQHRSFYGTGYIPAQLKIRWRFRTRWIRDSHIKGYGGRPLIWRGTGWSGQAAVVGDRVWVSSVGGMLYCLNRHNGRLIWSYRAGLSIKSSVTYWNNRVYFGSRSNRLYCLNATTGKLLWQFHTRGKNIDSTPLVWKGRLYWGAEDTHLYAMDPLNGKIFWKYKTMGNIESSPMIHGNKIYINSFDGHLHCVDLATGKLHWRFRTGDDTDTTPTYHRGLVYFGSENGKVYAVDAQTGELQWQRQTDGGVWSTPAMAGDRLFVGSNDRRIYGLDARTGRQLWKYIAGDGVWASLAYVAGRLLVGDWSGYVHILRGVDGQRLQRIRIGAEFSRDGNHIVSSASVIDGRVYLGSRDGHFYCFEGPKQPDARQQKRMARWRRLYGEDLSLVTKDPGALPATSTTALSDLDGTIKDAGQRNAIKSAMTSTSLAARLLVAKLLKAPGVSQAIGLLLLSHVLKDSADHIRLMGVHAAARYGKAGAALVAPLLEDRDDRIRAAVCRTLGKHGSKADAAAIQQQLWHPDALVQATCGAALLKVGDITTAKRALQRLLFGGGQGRRARGKSRGYGCPTRVSKYYLYRNGAGKMRRVPRYKLPILTALIALHQVGDSCATKHLYSRWYSCKNDPETGYCSIYSDWQGFMQRMLPFWVIPLAPAHKQLNLLKRLGLPRYKDGNLRANAVRALSKLETDQKAPILLPILRRDKYPLMRLLAARGLAQVDRKDVHKALATALAKDSYPDVRLEAARSLVALQAKKAIAALSQQLAKEPSDRAKAGIASLLALQGHTAAHAALQGAMTSPSMKARCLGMRGLVTYAKGFSLVQEQLQSPERFLRLCAIQALVKMPLYAKGFATLQQRKAALAQAVQHNDPAVNLRAAFALLPQ